MDHWDKIKKLFSPTEKDQKDQKEQKEEIVFTPEELREMQDRDTAVGRLLNPYYDDEFMSDFDRGLNERYPWYEKRYKGKGGPRELYYKGLGTPDKTSTPKYLQEIRQNLIADAYIKDAEKRGIIHPDEDRITKNYKIIEDIQKRKNLYNPITFKHLYDGSLSQYHDFDEYGIHNIYLSPLIAPFYQIDPDARRLADKPFSKEEVYEKIPLSEQKKIQRLINDLHLSTSIHELRHAEDFKNNRKKAKEDPNDLHFINANRYPIEDGDDAGKIHDIAAAALQRLSNMGKKKNE